MIKGWKKLTAKERKHLRDVANVRTTQQAEENFKHQKELRNRLDHKPCNEPCWECRIIANKLGYDT